MKYDSKLDRSSLYDDTDSEISSADEEISWMSDISNVAANNSSSTPTIEEEPTIREAVCSLAIRSRIPLIHLSSLLNLIRRLTSDLPADVRTLLGEASDVLTVTYLASFGGDSVSSFADCIFSALFADKVTYTLNFYGRHQDKKAFFASPLYAVILEKLTRFTDFARWEVRCKDQLQGVDAKAKSGAIRGLLDDEVYDLAVSRYLGSLNPFDFQRHYRQPGESVNDFQWALRLLGRRAFPTMNAKVLNTRVLERFVAGVCDPQIRKALLRDRPSTLDKALALAREEEFLQAACEQPPRSLFSVTAVQSHFSHDAATQMPWYPCSCGSYPRRNNWRRPQTPSPLHHPGH
ncbi:unnamed protein product [Schistocephalus solidus]|uniref:Uncharacterized protein n=1 Tax=Schistocephalus solidus TaxID=70667 RepID=A0A183SZW5_SCHSO|nr:unnamed protein product [Schistocephalus solidus]